MSAPDVSTPEGFAYYLDLFAKNYGTELDPEPTAEEFGIELALVPSDEEGAKP